MTPKDSFLIAIADELESDWTQLKRREFPVLDSYLSRVSPEQIACLAELLIPIDISHRLRLGIHVSPSDYIPVCPSGDFIALRFLEIHSTNVHSGQASTQAVTNSTPLKSEGHEDSATTQWWTAVHSGISHKNKLHQSDSNRNSEEKPFSSRGAEKTEAANFLRMSPEDYGIACKVLHEVLSLSPDVRAEKIKQLREQDFDLAARVEELISADQAAREVDFLKSFNSVADQKADIQRALPKLPRTIGGFEVISEIGRGGMGVVYRVFDAKGERFLALKAIQAAQFSGPEDIGRFRREAASTCQLNHPNIVRVYFVGSDELTDFFTMELIDGLNLQSILHQGPMQIREAARLLLKISLAVDYAHSKGIIHRDVKPGNILVDSAGEPKLVDFGLAKCPNSAGVNTRSEQLLGTLNYMAPEQISQASSVGPQADIYGLGATLYHCLTGMAPVSGVDFISTLQRIKDVQPARPSEFRKDIDKDLESICMRCLRKSPSERYSSARDLANDLQCFLDGKPISNAPESWWTSVTRQIKRDELPSKLASAPAATWLAGINLLFHGSIFSIIFFQLSDSLLWLVTGLWFIAVNLVNYFFHWSKFWQLSGIERQSGMVQLAFNFSFLFLVFINFPDGNSSEDQLSLHPFLKTYPPYALITAVSLMAHGQHFGRIILAAISLYPLSLFFSAVPLAGPIVFATLGTAFMFWSAKILNLSRD